MSKEQTQKKPIKVLTYVLLCQDHLTELLATWPNAELEAINSEERGKPCQVCTHRAGIVKVYTMATIEMVRTRDKK